MRQTARCVSAEADLLARKGRFEEAVRVQSRGFRVAAHAAKEPIQIPALVGAACQNITLAGMVNLLEHAESLPSEKRLKVHAQIRQAIVKNRLNIDPQRTNRGETAWMADEFRLIRRGIVRRRSAGSVEAGDHARRRLVAVSGPAGTVRRSSPRMAPPRGRRDRRSVQLAQRRPLAIPVPAHIDRVGPPLW